ncbi:MAG: hypothetical protein ACI8PZ_001150 [Myxococcota bacterium]|jgi:hypothetical protein
MTRIDWLGVAFIAMGVLLGATLFPIAAMLGLLPLLDPAEPAWPFLLASLFTAALGAVCGAGYVATGVGLGARMWWARIAALVLGALSLQSAPFGTALGAFSLFTLLDGETAREFT